MMSRETALAVFAKKSGYSIEQLLHVCDDILTNYDDMKEQYQWIHSIEPGRLMDALRLAIILTPSARDLIGSLKYRTERTTLFTRWLKVSLNKNLKSVTSRTFQSGNIIGFGGRSLEEVVATLGSMDVKEANQLSSELIRALIMKYRTNTDISDAFFNYLFSTTAKQLPNKLQRARQTLESKATAHVIFRALHECATAISGRPLINPAAATYLKIFHDVCPLQSHADKDMGDDDEVVKSSKKRKRKPEDLVFNDITDNSIMLDDGQGVLLTDSLGVAATLIPHDDTPSSPVHMSKKTGAVVTVDGGKALTMYSV